MLHRRTWFLVSLVLGDVFCLNLGFFLGYKLRFGGHVPLVNWQPYLQIAPYISLIAVGLFWLFGLYSGRLRRPREIVYSLILAVSLLTLIAIAAAFYARGFAFPRTVFVLAGLSQAFLLATWRCSWNALTQLRKSPRIVVVKTRGDGDILEQRLARIGVGNKSLGSVVAEVWAEAAATSDQALAGTDIVCVSPSLSRELKERVIARALEEGKEVILVPDFYDILVHHAYVDKIDDLAVFRIEDLSLTSGQELAKRLFDVVVSLGVLVVSLPLMLLIAIGIRLTSPGPVFYVQKRAGLGGKPFHLIKFRTMVEGAEDMTGPVLAAENDPRITRIGRFLRATRLDELPQFFNVLKGDMSVVGPRPERPFFVNQFQEALPAYRYRLKVKPGITGLAQVEGKYDTEAEDKLRYDLYYIRNYSLLLDLQLIMQTLRVMLTPESSRGKKSKDKVNEGILVLETKRLGKEASRISTSSEALSKDVGGS